MIVISGCIVNVLESLHLNNGENMKQKIFIARFVSSAFFLNKFWI